MAGLIDNVLDFARLEAAEGSRTTSIVLPEPVRGRVVAAVVVTVVPPETVMLTLRVLVPSVAW